MTAPPLAYVPLSFLCVRCMSALYHVCYHLSSGCCVKIAETPNHTRWLGVSLSYRRGTGVSGGRGLRLGLAGAADLVDDSERHGALGGHVLGLDGDGRGDGVGGPSQVLDDEQRLLV